MNGPRERETLVAMELRHGRERAALVHTLIDEAYAAGLNDMDQPSTARLPTLMATITNRVSAEFGISIRELRGPKRGAIYKEPRRLIWGELQERGYSLSQIGRFFGRDHTTIMHGLGLLGSQQTSPA